MCRYYCYLGINGPEHCEHSTWPSISELLIHNQPCICIAITIEGEKKSRRYDDEACAT